MKDMDTGNSTSGESSSQQNVETPRAERRTTRGPRQRGVDNLTKKFLRNFDPEHSEREKRKLHRRLYQGHKRHVLYDEQGIYTQTGDDLCDCLNLNCAGCHFPCPKCSSPKCGHECRFSMEKHFKRYNINRSRIKYKFVARINRKWTYDSIENEGSDVIIKNPLLKET